jgi:hypothetical protein
VGSFRQRSPVSGPFRTLHVSSVVICCAVLVPATAAIINPISKDKPFMSVLHVLLDSFGLPAAQGQHAPSSCVAPIAYMFRCPISPGTVLRRIAYMSPEQVRAKELKARTDLFSFETSAVWPRAKHKSRLAVRWWMTIRLFGAVQNSGTRDPPRLLSGTSP